MRSYLVLTPEGGPDRDHTSTLLVRDGFSWSALLFPWIWLFWHRLWLAGLCVLLAQFGSGALAQMNGFGPAGFLLGCAISLLVALEARHFYAESLVRRGWKLEGVISAPDEATAEEIYFSSLPVAEKQPLPVSAEWAKQVPQPQQSGWPGAGLGLFDYEGKR